MVSAYLARIGWRGATAPTAETLAGLLRAHMEAIPFENFDVLLGRGVRIDLDSLVAKLVTARRGGYCYEHATLFQHVLRELGFTVHAHSARVTMIGTRETSPRTHMFLTVELPGETVMVDPGFGSTAPRVPVPMTGAVTADGMTFSLARDAGYTSLRVGKKDVWVSTFERDVAVDFEMANHFTATHASSPFVTRILAQAYVPGGKVTIANDTVTIAGESRVVDRVALRAFVATHFGFDLPELEQLRVPTVPAWT